MTIVRTGWIETLVAAMNISIKGLAPFASSKGLAGEAMKGNVEKEPLILKVDASKLSLQLMTWQNYHNL